MIKKKYLNKGKNWTAPEFKELFSIAKNCYAFKCEEKDILKLSKKLQRTPLSVKVKVSSFRNFIFKTDITR